MSNNSFEDWVTLQGHNIRSITDYFSIDRAAEYVFAQHRLGFAVELDCSSQHRVNVLGRLLNSKPELLTDKRFLAQYAIGDDVLFQTVVDADLFARDDLKITQRQFKLTTCDFVIVEAFGQLTALSIDQYTQFLTVNRTSTRAWSARWNGAFLVDLDNLDVLTVGSSNNEWFVSTLTRNDGYWLKNFVYSCVQRNQVRKLESLFQMIGTASPLLQQAAEYLGKKYPKSAAFQARTLQTTSKPAGWFEDTWEPETPATEPFVLSNNNAKPEYDEELALVQAIQQSLEDCDQLWETACFEPPEPLTALPDKAASMPDLLIQFHQLHKNLGRVLNNAERFNREYPQQRHVEGTYLTPAFDAAERNYQITDEIPVAMCAESLRQSDNVCDSRLWALCSEHHRKNVMARLVSLQPELLSRSEFADVWPRVRLDLPDLGSESSMDVDDVVVFDGVVLSTWRAVEGLLDGSINAGRGRDSYVPPGERVRVFRVDGAWRTYAELPQISVAEILLSTPYWLENSLIYVRGNRLDTDHIVCLLAKRMRACGYLCDCDRNILTKIDPLFVECYNLFWSDTVQGCSSEQLESKLYRHLKAEGFL